MPEEPLAMLPHYRRLSETTVTSGQPTVEQLQQVAAQGIEVVINLGLAEADYALPDERGLVESLGLRYEHIPVVWDSPTPQDFQNFVVCMQHHAQRQRLVHCAANKRASAFMFLYRVVVEQCPVTIAITDLTAIWSLNPIWQTFVEAVLQESGQDIRDILLPSPSIEGL
jgi:protein tyrosine phosphatase (PTP) superfamily phosphohydrolase (DUF442 family)